MIANVNFYFSKIVKATCLRTHGFYIHITFFA